MQFFNAILSPCNRWDKLSKTAQRNYQEKTRMFLESGDNITHNPYTREMIQTDKETKGTSGYRDLNIYTTFIYKNKVSQFYFSLQG